MDTRPASKLTPLEHAYLGLVVGETLSWARIFERSQLLPYWTRRKRREIETQHDQAGILDQVLPFALNQPTEAFKAGPGSRAEWFYFQFHVFDHARGDYALTDALAAWRELANKRAALRLSIAEHSAISNLQRGELPPSSGYENPHYFDDSSIARALCLACLAPPARVEAAVREDAGITNAQDGIDASVALACLARALIDKQPLADALFFAQTTLPAGTWTTNLHEETQAASKHLTDAFSLIRVLGELTSNDAYSYGTSAPEVLAVVMALLAFAARTQRTGAVEAILLPALALPRTAHAVLPALGALLALAGFFPEETLLAYHDAPLVGVALPMLRGHLPRRAFADPSSRKVKPWQEL